MPPAPVPLPAAAAPWLEAFPVPATRAAGIGVGAGIRGWGATTGVASAFRDGAPASFFAWLGWRAGGGGVGGGGGGTRMSNVLSRSTAAVTMGTLRPVRMIAASAAWTAITAAIALA